MCCWEASWCCYGNAMWCRGLYRRHGPRRRLSGGTRGKEHRRHRWWRMAQARSTASQVDRAYYTGASPRLTSRLVRRAPPGGDTALLGESPGPHAYGMGRSAPPSVCRSAVTMVRRMHAAHRAAPTSAPSNDSRCGLGGRLMRRQGSQRGQPPPPSHPSSLCYGEDLSRLDISARPSCPGHRTGGGSALRPRQTGELPAVGASTTPTLPPPRRRPRNGRRAAAAFIPDGGGLRPRA